MCSFVCVACLSVTLFGLGLRVLALHKTESQTGLTTSRNKQVNFTATTLLSITALMRAVAPCGQLFFSGFAFFSILCKSDFRRELCWHRVYTSIYSGNKCSFYCRFPAFVSCTRGCLTLIRLARATPHPTRWKFHNHIPGSHAFLGQPSTPVYFVSALFAEIYKEQT